MVGGVVDGGCVVEVGILVGVDCGLDDGDEGVGEVVVGI